MSLLAKANVQTKDTDFVGGKLASDVYLSSVKMMYVDKNANGSVFVNIELQVKTADGSVRPYNETIYISNREGEFTYKDKKTGEDKPLPGYVLVDTLCKAANGKSLGEQDTDMKHIEVYDAATRGKTTAQKEVVMSMLKKQAKVAIVQETHNKNAKDASGKYVPTAETYTINTIKKVFNTDGLTQAEVEAGKTEGVFMASWLSQNQGKVFDKTVKPANGATAGGVSSAKGAAVDVDFD